MPPKKQLKKPKQESDSDDDVSVKVIGKKVGYTKKVTYASESGFSSSDSESSKASSESNDSDELNEKYDEVEDEDILGDTNNEVDDEDDSNESGDDKESSVADEKEEVVSEVDDVGDESDDCVYRFTKKKKGIIEDDEEGDVDYFSDDDVKIDENIYVSNEDRITKPVLTKYERVRILGERARQLSLGAKPMIKGLINMEPKDVARLELKLKVVPLIIIRTLPTGKKERWRVSELEIMN